MTSPWDEIRSVHHAVDVGVQLPDSWFRGHQEVAGRLTPRFFRNHADPILEAFKPGREAALIEDFRRDAYAIGDSAKLPKEDDSLGWMYRMQHYEAPTRLLDWTENVLAALFFTVSDKQKWETDGELWALNPWALNAKAGIGWATPYYDRNLVIQFLARDPYWKDRQALAETIAEEFRGTASDDWLDNPEPFDRPVAFKPRRDFERMLVQSSVFTIHPKPIEGNRITEILTDSCHLVRYIIPKTRKRDLWQHLQYLGVTDRSLFPDFEGLSRTVAPPVERVAIASDLPVPPKWEDEDAPD